MRVPHTQASFRPAFTLVELLIVVTIIALLMGLLTAGVFKVMDKGAIVRNHNDISQLAIALESFKTKFGFYPPSTITLNNTIASMSATDQSYIRGMFNRIGATVAWGGAGAGPWELQGDECLVFFLGGLPASSPPGCVGFSNNPTDPTAGGGTRISFFEFQTHRLVDLDGDGFYSYLDTYGTSNGNGTATGSPLSRPYAYFSSPRSPNAYASHCPALGLAPYYEAAGRYLKPSSFQLISAGKDRAFGPGGQWTPGSAGSIAAAGQDDQANFYDSLLGVQR